MSRFKVISLIVAFVSFILVGCGEKEKPAQVSKEINVRLQSSITSLDPIKVVDANTIQVIYNAYSHLYKMDENGKLVKDLVEKIEPKEGKKVWVVKIKEGVKFCVSGKEVTADDVKYSLNRVWKSPYSKVSWIFRDLKEIKKLDKYTVELVFNNPIDLPKYLSLPQVAIISKESMEKGTIESAGPYYISSTANNKVVLNSCQYSNLKPIYDKVTFKVINDDLLALSQFKKGDIDLLAVDPLLYNNLKVDKKFVKVIDNSANFYFVVLNTKKFPKELREKLVYSVDNKYLCDKLLKESCRPVDFVSAIYGGTNSLYNATLAEKGKTTEGKKKFVLLTLNRPDFIMAAEYISKSWKQLLGLDVNVKIVNFETMLSILFSGKDYDGALIWVSPMANLLEIWHLLWNPLDETPPKGRNVAYFYNPEYKALFLKYLRGEASLYDRVFLNRIEKVLEKDPPAVPLYNMKTVWVVKDSVAKELHFGRFNVIKLWVNGQ